MNKKTIYGIFLVLDILLGIVFFVNLVAASEELVWVYYEKEGMQPADILKYLDWESYGAVAVMSRAGLVGAKVKAEDQAYYLMGKYADMLFQEKTFEAKGDGKAAKRCGERRTAIRTALPEYGAVLDKMDQSMENALKNKE